MLGGSSRPVILFDWYKGANIDINKRDLKETLKTFFVNLHLSHLPLPALKER